MVVPMWRDGHHKRRRSPRISALDEWKQQGKAHQDPLRPQMSTGDHFSNSQKKKKNCKWVGVVAMEKEEEEEEGHHPRNGQGPPSRTRARIKRKLQKQKQMGIESPNHEDCSTNSDQLPIAKVDGSTKLDDHAISAGQTSVMSPVQFMPEKHILELVLDTLQRRDSYEIFAEPVDPKEVEDYYEIIKEPMDFGTMRAKLHEGMYTNLEQFEHDAFLIPRNAMHFNSTATVYFRQARSIYELAKKVFHVLKTDPENFELEFAGTRRRSGRRPQGEGKGLIFNSCPRLAANVGSSSKITNISSKGTQCSLSGPSNRRRNIRGNPRFSYIASCVDTRDYDFSPGAGGGKKSNVVEVDRRCSYRPWMSFHNSIVSTIYSDPKQLARVNQWGISYKESLMLFAKGLGPTAQMIANRKLRGLWKDAPNFLTPASNCWSQATTCLVPAACASTQNSPHTLDTLITTTCQDILDPFSWDCSSHKTADTIDLTNADDGEKAYTSDRIGNYSGLEGKATTNEGLTNHEYDEIKIFSNCDRNNFLENPINIHQVLYSSSFGAEDLNSSVNRISNTSKKSVAATVNSRSMDSLVQVQQSILASEHSHSNKLEFKLRNSNSSTATSSWPWHTGGFSSISQSNDCSLHGLGSTYEPIAAVLEPKGGVNSSSSQAGMDHHAFESNQVRPLVSPFAFDLPYLKSRLNQMNHGRQDSFMQTRFHQVSFNEGPSSSQMSNKRSSFDCTTQQAEPSTRRSQLGFDDQQCSGLDANLALQL